MLNKAIVGKRHYRVAREIRKTLATYKELKEIIAMLGMIYFGGLYWTVQMIGRVKYPGPSIHFNPLRSSRMR